MNKNLIPFLSFSPFVLAACLGGDPNGDGGADITHATGHWELQWECDQQGERIVGCSVGEIYDMPPDMDGQKMLGVSWQGEYGTGTLRSNALSVNFQHGALNSPEHYIEEAIYTFDRANPDIFTKSSTYQGQTASGVCSGTGKRIPETQTTCQPIY